MASVKDTRSEADDIQAITRQIHLYCRAMDRVDAELGYAIWHEDGEADYGEAIFQGTGRGFIDFVCESHRAMVGHSHQVTNIIINLAGDRAASESYVTAALRIADGSGIKQITTRGRYLDRWSFRDRWAIDKRIYVHDFDDVRRIDEVSIVGWSKRDRSDPSYAILDAKAGARY